MGYCTVPQLKSHGLNPDAFDSKTAAERQQAIDSQASLMDGYLVEHPYELPILEPYPDVLIECNAKLAAISLIISQGVDPEADKLVFIERTYWIDWLKGVAKGTTSPPEIIDSTPGATPGSSSVPSVRVTSSTSRGYSTRGTGEQRGPFQTD